jgi:hypothetical protein
MITLLRNDGHMKYEHHDEGGEHHGGKMELGHCSYSVRNHRQNTLMRITYGNDTLAVHVKRESDINWRVCASAPAVNLETGMFIGLSAATGHLADNHDIHGVTVRNLDDDAKFIDSEARFAQFSKYVISESLGRIEADLQQATWLARHPLPVNKPAEEEDDDGGAINALSTLRADLARIVSTIERNVIIPPPSARSGQPLAPFFRDLQDDVKSDVASLTAVTHKLMNIHATLAEVRDERRRFEDMRRRASSEPPPSSSFFSFLNILFVLACVVAAYLGFVLYRTKAHRM